MKIKEVKRNRKQKRRLLGFLCILMVVSVGMFAACAIKTFLLALMGATTPVMIGAACSLAALYIAALLEKTIKEVYKLGVNTRIRQMEDNGTRRAA